MFIGKIRMAASVAIAIGVIGMGGVWLSHSSVIAGPDEPKPGERIERGPRKATDLDRMQGAWKMMSAESGGKSEDVAGAVLKFSNSSMTVQRGAEKPEAEFTVKLNSSAKPPRIDITKGDRVMPGIYELKGDKLKLCFREKGDERPTEFASEAGSKIVLIELERETPTEPEQPRVFKSKDEEIEALRNEVKKLKAQLGSERERNIKLVKQATNAERLAMMQREEAEAARRQAEVAAERERVARDLAQAARKAAEAQRAAAEKALKDAQDAARKVRENLEKKGPSKP